MYARISIWAMCLFYYNLPDFKTITHRRRDRKWHVTTPTIQVRKHETAFLIALFLRDKRDVKYRQFCGDKIENALSD